MVFDCILLLFHLPVSATPCLTSLLPLFGHGVLRRDLMIAGASNVHSAHIFPLKPKRSRLLGANARVETPSQMSKTQPMASTVRSQTWDLLPSLCSGIVSGGGSGSGSGSSNSSSSSSSISSGSGRSIVSGSGGRRVVGVTVAFAIGGGCGVDSNCHRLARSERRSSPHPSAR